MKPQMIQLEIDCNSAWRSVFISALKEYLQKWGYSVTQYRQGSVEIFIGTQTRE